MTIEASASDPALLPAGSVEVLGDGAERSLRITPPAGAAGSTEITVVARDAAGLEDSVTFVLEVTPRPLSRESGTTPRGTTPSGDHDHAARKARRPE
ncbi:MAG: hypothetical protein U5K81_07150 [Trueperaceae bacterium]|nr:hypothetical protein [Trueperaceae bacterium]